MRRHDLARHHLRRVGGLAWAEGHLGGELRLPWRRELVVHGRVDGPEPAVLDHGLQLASAEEFSLLQQARDHGGRRGFQALLDKGDECHIAYDLDVLL